MEHKALGRTGEQIPEIGIGTWQYRAGAAPIRKSVELGGVLVDTAEVYGTEEAVGEAIAGIRGEVFLATKVWPTHFRRAAVLRAADASLRRLKTDVIDLYQLHWPNPLVPIGETIGAMEALVDQGKVRHIGVSNFSVAQLSAAQAAAGKHAIVSNQVPLSLLDRRVEQDLVQYCAANGVSLIAYSPLARGLRKLRADDRSGVLAQVASETERTEAQVALAWCVSKAQVVAIPKASSATRIAENCAASGWRLDEDQIARLEAAYPRRGRLEAVVRRFARGWAR